MVSKKQKELLHKRVNVNPKSWGSAGWVFIDKIIAGYPLIATEEEQQNMQQFLSSLHVLLPCKVCRTTYGNYILENPPDDAIKGRKQLQKWLKRYRHKMN